MKKGEKKMKKNIEWLKKEIATEMIELEPNRKERWSDVKYQTLRSVAQKLDQLDEPEALSKEWVNNNVVHVRGLGDIFEAETVENLLVPKQELPVIPKYVAEWITKHRDTFDLYPMLKRLEKNSSTWKQTYKWYRENTHIFVNAFLTGEYEVEEEPLYYALIKGHELIADEDAWACNYWNLSILDGRVFPSDKSSSDGLFSTKMTKSEWNELGIDDSNADFVRVEENE